MSSDETMKKLTEVQARHADELMTYANVVGCGIGLAMKEGLYTDTPALVVMVSVKLPVAQLDPKDVLPRQLEGERVDVQQTGDFTAQTEPNATADLKTDSPGKSATTGTATVVDDDLLTSESD
ncbi:MAG: hypothetical protein KC708_09410 [Anaerolineae bacterium]|nr:hypothetical protein [Anaerolineae bacterium]